MCKARLRGDSWVFGAPTDRHFNESRQAGSPGALNSSWCECGLIPRDRKPWSSPGSNPGKAPLKSRANLRGNHNVQKPTGRGTRVKNLVERQRYLIIALSGLSKDGAGQSGYRRCKEASHWSLLLPLHNFRDEPVHGRKPRFSLDIFAQCKVGSRKKYHSLAGFGQMHYFCRVV